MRSLLKKSYYQIKALLENTICFLAYVALMQLSAQAGNYDSGNLISEQPYHFKHKNYDEFVTFLKGFKRYYTPWTDIQIRTSFPRDIYDRCDSGKDIKMSKLLYQGKNGIVRGWAIQPLNVQKKMPVVVYNRGGFAKWGRIVGLEIAMLCRISAQGYIVIASDFRGPEEGKMGHDKTDLGYGDVHDSFDMIKAIGNTYSLADTNNIAVWGFSRGTTIAAMMVNLSDKVRAVILHGVIADVVNNDRRAEFDEHVYPLLIENYASLTKSEQDKLLSGISPEHIMDQIKGKPAFMIFHGAHDKRTSASHAMRYGQKLLERKYPVEFHLYQQSGHALVGNYNEYIGEVIDWLDRYLPKN